MENAIQMFQFQQHAVRVVKDEQGEPWFVAKDVADVLGYENTAEAIRDHCKNVVLVRGSEMLGASDYNGARALGHSHNDIVRQYQIIPERDVYRLVMRSKLPAAEKFEEWVVGEVLPSIRKHGGYMTPEKIEEALLNPDTLIKLATDLKEERAKRLALASKVEKDAPKVLFADSVSASSSSILVGELAKILKQNGIDIGQNRLFERLRKEGFLMKEGSSRNMPTQRSMDMGLFKIKETVINKPDGSLLVQKTVKVTGKGSVYFVDYFLRDRREEARGA